MGDRGAFQIDIGIVFSNLGAHSDNDREGFNGLFSLMGIDFGLYVGPSYNLFQTVGPSIGAGLLIGSNGFLAGKVGIHIKRRFGLAILFPIVPVYGAGAANFLSTLPIPESIKLGATIPLLIVPAAIAYQDDIIQSHKSIAKRFNKLKTYVVDRMHFY
jgi:hypothetical protein